MKKVHQKFNINDDTKSVNILLAPHFKLKAIMSPTTIAEREYITRVPYTRAFGCLMYAMVCTKSDLSQTVSMISRYIQNPNRGHWEEVK